ncbi:hypothetical protein CPB83DRAFT_852129 [Crepidotus variabilis]|uniref:Uncharacterized protein n=1 Tax=Crepidotus variabilis TaxID=179855 RepID=A0A9P6JRC3_9AGAR|nr:hypothetical protein CPB83DRAFT_852129 [Crepidotus variabilis]
MASSWRSQLTEFYLHKQLWISPIYPCADVYAALAQMPNLELFSVECAVLDFSNDTPHLSNSICLPKLRRLELNGEAFECFNVILTLHIPPTCALLIQISAKDIGLPDGTFPLLAQQPSEFLHSFFPPIHTLTLKIGISQFSVVTEARTNLFFSSSAQQVGMTIQGGWKTLQYGDIFESVRLVEFAAQLTSLNFDIVQRAVPEALAAHPAGQEILDQFLKGLVHLTNLTCSNFSVDYLIRIRLPILPKLRSLTIKGAATRLWSVSSAAIVFKRWRSGQGLPPVEITEIVDSEL